MAARRSVIRHCEGVARSNLILLLLASILFGCRPEAPRPSSADLMQTAAAPTGEASAGTARSTSVPEEVTKIRNGQYQLGATDVARTVQLTNGKHEEGTPGSDNFLSVVMTD